MIKSSSELGICFIGLESVKWRSAMAAASSSERSSSSRSLTSIVGGPTWVSGMVLASEGGSESLMSESSEVSGRFCFGGRGDGG